ncbi:MAG TPA: anthrax toxin-like adenylyl cyclase domain-containing protein [Terracidiphilus sp.]|nr:anthrax toxin-like adenylyl cyclase domain-containing protein [Terracidiphilus sp.]
MAVYGLEGSFAHTENGMKKDDMLAAARVADRLNEVIIFRSTGPWSRRWIELGYPTKNFHVKGKSSDWGPQAGFVPYNGVYSKVGSDPVKAQKGTQANDHGIHDHFAATTQLTLTKQEIDKQANDPEEAPPRKAIDRVLPVAGGDDLILFAKRTGDNKEFAFRAVFNKAANAYRIEVLDERLGTNFYKLLEKRGTPLLVMTSSEAGANNRPMTGDYDLMAVCPTWNDYGSMTRAEVSKPGLNFTGKGVQPGQAFSGLVPGNNGSLGSRLDKVLDMTTTTAAKKAGTSPGLNAAGQLKAKGADEHPDMGNLTPRILRCINELNAEMGGDTPFRRVHHNAESHRNAMFGALTGAEMQRGEGLPLTVFQPGRLSHGTAVAEYQNVCTLESLDEFKTYAFRLSQAEYYVPRNWTWGMSVRDNRAMYEHIGETLAARFKRT